MAKIHEWLLIDVNNSGIQERIDLPIENELNR